jgi:hypothetical protein
MDPAPDPASIDDVIRRLVKVLGWARDRSSRIGYFTALYHEVTVAIRDAVQDGTFENPARIERLDVVFASRYLNALDRFLAEEKPTGAWHFSFEVSRRWWPTVTQHLLIAANAHINLDLGIAVAETVPAAELDAFQSDYLKVNAILSGVVPAVESDLSAIWPLLNVVNEYFSAEETWFINLDMQNVREKAWVLALRLSQLEGGGRDELIADLDRRVTALSHVIDHPGLLLGLVLKAVRIGEIGSIRGHIDRLLQKAEVRRKSRYL